jgi:hypothetical protein
MKTNKTYIFFVFLAAIVFNAHMIIPHDHHQTDSDHCQTSSLPIENNSSHHPGFPVHCHAFNGLSAEEAIINPLINHFQSVQFINLPSAQETQPVLSFQRISFPDVSKKPITSRPSDFFSLRAPPTFI